MGLDYCNLMAMPPLESVQDLTVRDTMLYALGVGVGAEMPTDPGELQYVYEAGLKALPTMAVVLAHPGFWARDPKYGLTWQKLLHGEQWITLHRPLEVQGRIHGVTTIDEIFDKGADKGAVLISTRKLYLGSTGDPLATVTQSMFLRADGGFGGKTEGAPKPHPLPHRPADLTARAAGRRDQALLYRLSGDFNPLHVDPQVAVVGGFSAPILHGLAGYGMVGRALIKSLCGDRPDRLRRLDVRFSSPVYPGETLEIDIWKESPGQAAFRVRALERDVVVQQNGFVEFGD